MTGRLPFGDVGKTGICWSLVVLEGEIINVQGGAVRQVGTLGCPRGKSVQKRFGRKAKSLAETEDQSDRQTSTTKVIPSISKGMMMLGPPRTWAILWLFPETTVG